MLRFYIGKWYSRLYRYLWSRYNIRLRGLGYILRHIDRDHIIDVQGQKMLLNHKVAGCYGLLIDGQYNEPETHIFFRQLLTRLDFSIQFVDVGANIGEMITDFARYERVNRIVGFEPYTECANACRATAKLNGYENKVTIVEKALSDRSGPSRFHFNQNSPSLSSLNLVSDVDETDIDTSTLDLELRNWSDPAIILIDVEGAEPLVMSGGKEFIATTRPLIIFEYNHLSKQFFSLEKISATLGPHYDIFRLRQDGKLDRDLTLTWNCVAVSIDSKFYEPAQALVLQ